MYDTPMQVFTYLRKSSAQSQARQFHDFLLRCLDRPPLRVPHLQAPWLLRNSLGTIRAAVRRTTSCIRVGPAKHWIQRRLRATAMGQTTVQQVKPKHVPNRMSAKDYKGLHPHELAH